MSDLLITPDFSEMIEFDDAQVPPGVYNVRVDSWEKKTSKAGNDYLNWKLVIFGAEDDLAKQNNRVLFLITMLSGKAAGKLKEFLTAALGTIPPKGFNPDALVGKELQVRCVKNIRPDGTEGFPEIKSIKAL